MSECDKVGHKPGMWIRVDHNQQERKCIVCGLIVATANIPQEKPAL